MGFWMLLEVASMPTLQVLIISVLGALIATPSCNILHADARKSLNKLVFMVFTPSLMFASLAKTVTLQDIISWWFMPVNIGLTFLFGGILGWALVKLLKPQKHLQGLIVATSSSGNLGNLMLIIVPAICHEKGSPFGNHDVCGSVGLSYASFSMALGGFYIWTYTYQLIRTSALAYKGTADDQDDEKEVIDKRPKANRDLESPLLVKPVEDNADQLAVVVLPTNTTTTTKPNCSSNIPDDHGTPATLHHHQSHQAQGSAIKMEIARFSSCWGTVLAFLRQILEELMAPPTLAAIVGFIFGATTWLRNLIIGDGAPLQVIQDSVKLLGDGTIPCITLILGGNLTQGLGSKKIKPVVLLGVICIRYLLLPLIGICVVKAAGSLGFLLSDRLYHFVLLIQFAMPPAMNIATMAELFDVGQEECSVILVWTYFVAALALTVWSTVYLWILS